MEKEKFNEIIEKIKYEREKWYSFHEIESLYMLSGKGIYPNWKHLRFLITKDNRILVKHGRSRPYGARLNGLILASGDYKSMTFMAGKEGFQIEASAFYPEGFRQVKIGDVLRISEGIDRIHGEAHIKSIMGSLNSLIINLWEPLVLPKNGRFSFYDPQVFYNNSANCIHATMNEGIYMEFVENPSKKKFKDSPYHEEIKAKDIKEINLLIGKEFYNKTYKLE